MLDILALTSELSEKILCLKAKADASPPLPIKAMFSNKRVCVFVDGENLRHSIETLFPSFDKRNYLPKATWESFFDWVALEAAGTTADRVRTYWYVVQNIDFAPFNLNSARKDVALLEKLLLRDKESERRISEAVNGVEKNGLMLQMADELLGFQDMMQKRFGGWINIQDIIAGSNVAVEFRRAGSIRYNLFKRTLGSEKAVDIKLATDLIILKDIYDVAVIVSGDQDYVPAVNAIKDYGKRAVNVAFQKEGGTLLPGGAKRLGQATDWSIEVDYQRLKSFLNL